MSNLLWTPGVATPVDALLERLQRQIELFAEDRKLDRAFVEVELFDGSRYTVETMDANPGFGFVTIRPHRAKDDHEPDEVVVQIGAIKKIEISAAGEGRTTLGFSVGASAGT